MFAGDGGASRVTFDDANIEDDNGSSNDSDLSVYDGGCIVFERFRVDKEVEDDKQNVHKNKDADVTDSEGSITNIQIWQFQIK